LLLKDTTGQLTGGLDPSPNPSPNLSLALSYKEREAEYIFLFGGAFRLPLPCKKKRSILCHLPCKKSEASSVLPPLVGGNEGGWGEREGWEGGWGVRFFQFTSRIL